MIEITNTQTFGFEGAIRGMRNPMNSWDKSDSYWEFPEPDFFENCRDCACLTKHAEYSIGKEDLALCKKLVHAGQPSHRKFLRMMHVQMDVNSSWYFWKQFDQYKIGAVTNSRSSMHKLTAKEFTLDDFSHEHLSESSLKFLEETVKKLNVRRKEYLKYFQSPSRKFDKNSAGILKDLWWQMIQLLPSSYNQLRTVDTNYEVLLNIYHGRKNHKLDEWREFCRWIETLPYMKEFLAPEEKKGDTLE